MKKLFTLLFIISAVGAVLFFDNESNNKIETSEEQVFNKDYEKWYFERYRDPNTGKIPDNIRYLEGEYVSQIPGSYKYQKNKNAEIQSVNDWKIRGPYYIGGRTRALLFDVNNPGKIISGGVDAGIYSTTDDGSTWVQKTRPDQFASVTTIDQDRRQGKTNIWYHGTGERLGSRVNGNGIYKSTDNGDSWFRLESTVNGNIGSWDNTFDFVYRVRTNPTAPQEEDQVYAATSAAGIMRSTDGGDSWNRVLGGNLSGTTSGYSDIEVTPSGVFYATMSSIGFGNDAIQKGIFRSTDGENWTEITPPDFPNEFARIVIGIAPNDENQVWFFGETPGSGVLTTNSRGDSLWHGLWKYNYKSGDGTGEGGQWTTLTENLPDPELVRHQINTQGGYDMVIKVHPADTNAVFIGGVNLYRSTTGWTTKEFDVIGGTCPHGDCDYHYRYPNHHADLHNITFDPVNPNIMYTVSDGGVHKTIDPMAESVEWISLNNGYYSTQYYSVAVEQSTPGDESILGGLQDNGTLFTNSSETDSEWPVVLRADGFHCQIADGRDFIITSQNYSRQPRIKIWKTEIGENGELLRAGRIDPIGGKDFIWDTPFVLDPNDNNKFYIAGGKSVWRNNDLSKVRMADFTDTGWKDFDTAEDSISTEWDNLTKTLLTNDDEENHNITAIHVSKNPSDILFYGTNRGQVYRIDNADQGDPEPIEITGNEFQANATVGCIVTDPENADEVVVVLTNYGIKSIFRSTDRGENWEQIGGNLEENPSGSGAGPAINWMEIFHVDNKKVYMVGTTTGLYFTTYINGMGTPWMKEAEILIGNRNIMMLDVRDIDNYVAVSTYATGTYSTYFNELPSVPGAVSLISPENDLTDIEDTQSFEWEESPGAIFYKLEIAIDENFNNVIFENSSIRETSRIVTDLPQGYKKLFWRVTGLNAGGEGTTSQVREFTTALGPPELILPVDGSVDVPLSSSLEWELMPEPVEKYSVQIAENAFFASPVFDEEVTGNSISLPPLKGETRYFWRVKAITNDAESDYAFRYSFTTGEASSVTSLGVGESLNVYPQPAQNRINIELKLNNNTPLEFSISDYTGKKVNGLSQKLSLNNYFNIEADISSLSNGLYFINLKGNGINIYRKIIVEK